MRRLTTIAILAACCLSTGCAHERLEVPVPRPKPLTCRYVFCLLPFQTDETTLAIGAYIRTRNMLEDIADAGRYEVIFPDLKADPRNARVYDPLHDRDVAAAITTKAGTLSITLTLTDYPVWIIVKNVNGRRGGDPLTATEGTPPYP